MWKFVACDFPEANEFTLHIFSAVAQHERKMISERTRAALQAAKARGVTLGNPQNLTREAAEKGRKPGIQARVSKADDFSSQRYPEIKHCLEQGMSLNVAKKFNMEEVRRLASTGASRTMWSTLPPGRSSTHRPRLSKCR